MVSVSELFFDVTKELKNIGALKVIPFSSTNRIGLEETTNEIVNWINPKDES